MIYRLMEQPYKYKSLDLDMITLFEKVGSEELGLKIFNQSDTNLSLEKDWVPFDCDYFEMPDTKNLQNPDIFLWLDSYLIMTHEAKEIFQPFLSEYGEFLPISIAGTAHYLFNCMSWGKEDPLLTKYKFDAGIPTGLLKLSFLIDDVESKLLFKSQISFCGSLFCNDHFKNICEKYEFYGLRFEEDLVATL